MESKYGFEGRVHDAAFVVLETLHRPLGTGAVDERRYLPVGRLLSSDAQADDLVPT